MIVLWPYNVSTKRIITEDAITNRRDISFFNSFGSIEVIKDGNQKIATSLDELKSIVGKEDMHLLCPSIQECKMMENQLKKSKIKASIKKESFDF